MFLGINHVAIVVRSVRDGLRFYHDLLGLPVGHQATVADQGVHAALLPVGRDEIELLEPTNPAGGVARFLEKKGEGIHHICIETPDVATALSRVKAAGLPVIDQVPRRGLAGTIAFLHPGACHGVLVEMAQRSEGAHGERPSSEGIRASRVATLYVAAKDVAAAAENFAKNFDAEVGPTDRDPAFGVLRVVVGLDASCLTLLDATELAAAPADDPFLGARREGVLGFCLAVEDLAAARGYLTARGIGCADRNARGVSPIVRVTADNTHGVSLYLRPDR